MIYSSTADPLLGPPTTEAGIFAILEDAVTHNEQEGTAITNAFKKTKKDIWYVDAKDSNPAGYAKCIQHGGKDSRFCYTVVRNAGHET